MTEDSDAAWHETLSALRDEVARVTALMRSVSPGTGAPALGQWTLADIAAHLAHVWTGIPMLAQGGASSGFIRTLDDLSTFTTDLNETDDERDLTVLADRIDANAAAYFASCVGQDPDLRRPWMVEDTTFPQSSFTGHLLSETVVHGWDIADAAGRRWPIAPDHARLALERFLFPVMGMVDPGAMVNAENAEGFQGAYEIRVRGGAAVCLRFDDDGLHVGPSAGQRIDCHLSVDPAALLLLIWGRRGPWPTILKGQLWVWGRRPWLAASLPRLIRNP